MFAVYFAYTSGLLFIICIRQISARLRYEKDFARSTRLILLKAALLKMFRANTYTFAGPFSYRSEWLGRPLFRDQLCLHQQPQPLRKMIKPTNTRSKCINQTVAYREYNTRQQLQYIICPISLQTPHIHLNASPRYQHSRIYP
jgi:hypothetical protein